ncbi:RluA family pseudouridine synthase [Pseudoflavonifractor sp. 524-17]|uniref:RluA family pseudouridine synthase n=1 Tax=Pseudoflavonifractor sp. 524-17 TaxID=2304577 RepID=UPI00137B6B2B|nr:RluA family pseudouridine synthase [Pseudoflavonifractor sp. 524-17]NCE65590.1 RluA family pseudouridine synthase [Pseudoflavonifractor sp. 524-17]
MELAAGSGAGPRRLTLTVGAQQAGQRVDTLLRRTLRLSGTSVKRAKTAGGILLDGQPVTVRAQAQAGQILSVRVGDTQWDDSVLPAPGAVDIVYEDGDILILNKAPGVAVHPGPGHFDDTLGNFIINYYKMTSQVAKFRPVNRLDRGTSGLMCVAKHAHAQEILKGQLHTPAFARIYLAVCGGCPVPEAGVVDAPIGRSADSILRREVQPEGAPARTRYQVLKKGVRSLVKLALDTGRTHQIRVHMAHLGCPLTGDFLYGQEDKSLISRPALHSAELALVHPVTQKFLRWTTPLPEDMAALLKT